ncbi:MAG TPA: N-acetylmuramoyl-L-alanine amidase [Caulobacteraceae bacterium]|nr:N-acetylmuramoyl-L-alanine amidase [Caulobacteraceae bacterium]
MTPIPAPSPNFNARLALPDMILLHYTGMPSAEAALARMRDPASEVSAHYMVDETGRVFALVPEDDRAWHAGKAFWRGATDINSLSFGIELANPGHEFGYAPYPDVQIAALIELIADIRSRWTVPDRRILGHSDVAPGRKQDPGELFPWKRLAAAGQGLWVEPRPAPGGALRQGEAGTGVFALQAGLTRLGYDVPPSGQYDAWTTTVVGAFQSHWRQSLLDGEADGETRARLMALLRFTAP